MEYLRNEKEKEAIGYMEQAAKIAEKALCLNAKCGAVIVNNGVIIGKGYNSPPRDEEENRMCSREFALNKPKYDKTCCMHAEWRAIMDAIKTNSQKIKESNIYFVRIDEKGGIKRSGKPYCTVCSRMALDVGIKNFVLWHEDGICEYPTVQYNQLSYEYAPDSQ